jgi:HAD superfamily hydrolase (TIGR01509 family)
VSLAVIFDVDGLLLDTERISSEGWRRAMSVRGYTLTDKFYLNMVGLTPKDVRPIMAAEFGDNFPFDEAYADRLEYIDNYVRLHGIPDRPGSRELLDYLKDKNLRMAVASSAPGARSREKLALTCLDDYFEVFVFGDEVVNGKPAPDIFLGAANGLGVPPQNCIVLEDSAAGVRAAHAAGIDVIMVPDLIQPDDELHAMALAVLPDLFAVKQLFDEQLIPQS